MKTIKIIFTTILLSTNIACATTTNIDKQQHYEAYKPCAHITPNKVSKCMK